MTVRSDHRAMSAAIPCGPAPKSTVIAFTPRFLAATPTRGGERGAAEQRTLVATVEIAVIATGAPGPDQTRPDIPISYLRRI